MGPARGKAEPAEPRPGPTPARRRGLHGTRQQAHRTDRAGSANIRAGRSGATAGVSGLADIEPRPKEQNPGILNCESRSTPSSQRQTVKMSGSTGFELSRRLESLAP